MKKLIIALLIIFVWAIAAYFSYPIAMKTFRNGCCSYHGGVCGGAGLKLKCCDGSISPTCSYFK